MRRRLTIQNLQEYRARNAACPERTRTREKYGASGERACPSCRHMVRLCEEVEALWADRQPTVSWNGEPFAAVPHA